jgi:RimJ/RimL family protein N-acetyltransferase
MAAAGQGGRPSGTPRDVEWWPLRRLRLRTPRLELRLPTEQDLYTLASLAADGVHDPLMQPFMFPWTDVSPPERARGVMQYQWTKWGQWKPEKWTLELAVVRDGRVVGIQGASAENFAVLRQVTTGSWLGMAHHGQGTGTEMRAAILHLAFAGLGAREAVSEAFADNPASLGVSRKLGYVPDGVELFVRRGERAVSQRLRLDRATWEANRSVEVTIEGLEACLPMFGLPEAGSA